MSESGKRSYMREKDKKLCLKGQLPLDVYDTCKRVALPADVLQYTTSEGTLLKTLPTQKLYGGFVIIP